jgi:hypothetical protein
MILKFITRNKLTFIGMLIGLGSGYTYYHFVGCSSGSCAITSNPINSTLYGAILGGLFFNIFQKPLK